MPKPLSDDLRERVIEYTKEGFAQVQIATILKVSTAFVSRLIKRYEETGSLLPKKPMVTKPRKVDYSKIQQYIEQNPDKTQVEFSRHFGLSDKAMWYILKKLNITYKKTILVRGKEGRFEKGVSKSLDGD